MSRKMKRVRIKHILFGFLTLFIICLLIVSYTDHYIQKLIQEKRFLVATQYYSAPKKFYVGQVKSIAQFKSYFSSKNYRQRTFGSPINIGDYSLGQKEECHKIVKSTDDVFSCLFFKPKQFQKLFFLNLNELDQIIGIFSGDELLPVLFAQAEAETFAQYLGNKPTQQIKVPLGDIPRYCLDAVIAIEDPDFLEHKGISVRGIFRALMTNVQNVRWSQGGSTITQQLVKNYFLSPEKKIIRKIKEIFISLIFEFRVSKDDILETYLNIIYLGQSGVYEVRGYASASTYYFQKPIESLDLSECSLLAAIVNSPGRYHPVHHPDRALERRQRVLTKMLEQKLISNDELDEAIKRPLPKKVKANLSASAPYYVDAVNKKLKEFGITDLSGLKVFTALDPQAQNFAEQAVVKGIENFEKSYPSIKKIKEEKSLDLQAALLASNPVTGEVVAIVGGRNFSSSPYNRAIESQRQVGSIFKPFVYLSALQSTDPTGAPYTPLTKINNSPLKYEYGKQIWEPRNYDNSFSQPVPLFYALKESINIPTARLAIDVGLNQVIRTARDLGVESKLKEFPSISLGAFELNPLEVLKSYNTISQMGLKQKLQIVNLVTNQKDEILYSHEPEMENVSSPEEFAVLIGMMKETLNSGTGHYTRQMGFNYIAAGKTGTTSDTKDAWFAGFTPFHTAVVWVGYDNGTSHHLTGASGALPLWTNYMKEISKSYSNQEFPFPDTVHKEFFTRDQLIEMGVSEEKAVDTELIFKNDVK
jgi:penicillin-binding protein 1B